MIASPIYAVVRFCSAIFDAATIRARHSALATRHFAAGAGQPNQRTDPFG
nr:hypothetical protein [Kibdelosporangium sp. MJ126-NF4]CTQ95511.1 hypothetical protein [Kibdelosporangium sp. MJ126-NF4]